MRTESEICWRSFLPAILNNNPTVTAPEINIVRPSLVPSWSLRRMIQKSKHSRDALATRRTSGVRYLKVQVHPGNSEGYWMSRVKMRWLYTEIHDGWRHKLNFFQIVWIDEVQLFPVEIIQCFVKSRNFPVPAKRILDGLKSWAVQDWHLL